MLWKTLICLLVAVAAVNAASITVRPTSTTFTIGLYSEYIFVETAAEPAQEITVSFAEVNSLGTAPDSYHLQIKGNTPGAVGTDTVGPFKQSFSFRVQADKPGTFYILVTSPAVGDFLQTSRLVTVNVDKRTITIEQPALNMKIGFPTPPYKVSVDVPSTSSLTLTPNTDDTGYLANRSIEINPFPSIVIPANALSTSFFLTVPTSTFLTSVTFGWSVSGAEQDYYTSAADLVLPTNFPLSTTKREITIFTDDDLEVVPGQTGNYFFYAYAKDLPNNTVTITPQAADTVFTPATFEFTSQQQAVRFKLTTTSPDYAKDVNFFLTQSADQDFYNEPTTISMNVPRRTVYVDMPLNGNILMGNRTFITLSVITPVATSLTVTMAAAHLTFSQSAVTFSGNVTSIIVAVDAKNIGTDQVSFYLSGADADAGYFNTIGDETVTVFKGSFITPSGWYIPKLFVGQESPEIPIRCSVSPLSNQGVTLTPVSNYIRFTPSSMTFRNGSEQAYFTATPLYTNDRFDDVERTVSFLITGPDAVMFNEPADFTVNVSRRSVVVHWSDHLSNTVGDSRSNTRHLGKTYKIWVAPNYVGEDDSFTITPTSAYYSFEPAVMEFDEDNTRVLLEATVTGVSSSARISYQLGGSEGGWYAPPGDDTYSTAIRPLAIEGYQVSPDTRMPRNKAAVMDTFIDRSYFNLGHLQTYNVYSFVVRSFVLPDGGLTITPKCAHATFSPSSMSLGAGDAVEIVDSMAPQIQAGKGRINPNPLGSNFYYLFNNTGLYIQANFSVNAKAGGSHLVTFELSGDDAGFYDRPNDQKMYFGTVERASDEPVQSAAGFVAPSIAMLFVAAVYALFL